MEIEKEFLVERSREEIAARLDDDESFAALFPDTSVERIDESTRETRTPYPGPGKARDIRFIFRTRPDGDVDFEKVCDGNVWRSLVGQVKLEALDEEMTQVILRMEGRTRAFVPEITIRIPMREQIDQMAKALRARLEES
jgi:carbon monoxide dehydrogenase subunit G